MPHFGTETDTALFRPVANDFLETIERAAANKQDIGGVHLHEVLIRMFAAALRRYRRNCPLNKFQQGLLHPFTGHVTGD